MTISRVNILNLESYEIIEKLSQNEFIKFYQIRDKDTNKNYLAKMLTKLLNKLPKEDLLDLTRELNIISKIKHPSCLNFIGFCPTNFKNKPKAVFVWDYPTHLNLGQLIQDEEPLTNTQKLIIIYGIASAMSFLHSNNVLHRNLTSYNIFLDDHYYPKLSGFNRSIEISKSDKFIFEMKLYNWSQFHAPEIFLYLKYSKASDVYSFGLLIHHLIAKKLPFDKIEDLDELYKNVVTKESLPELDESIPQCLRSLIEKCLSRDPIKRPNFDQIIYELKNNDEFTKCFGEDFDNESFLNYMKYIDESPQKYETCEYKLDQIEELLTKESHLFNKSDFLKEKLNFLKNSKLYVNLNDFERNSSHRLENKETKIIYDVNKMENVSFYLRNEIKTIANKVNTISQLDHPSIVKLGGFSPVDFQNNPNPVFLTEKSGKKCEFWYGENYTPNILITFYGIATGMAYLHSHDIIHRDLKVENIGINEDGVPMIKGFHLSKSINDDNIKPNKKIKGTPACIAPEVYMHKGYCKASDVYAFAMIIYQILTHKRPYSSLLSTMDIQNKVTLENCRPNLSSSFLPKIYKELIERCWSQDPKDRPTFEEIAFELKTNPDYLTADINKENFFEFVDYIDEYPAKFDPKRKVKFFDDILTTNLHTFQDIRTSFLLEDMYETEVNNLLITNDYLNVSNLEFINEIAKGNFYEVKEVLFEDTNTSYAGKIAPKFDLLRNELINFYRELNILLQLNHPSILNFIGYSVYNGSNLLLITEFSSIGSLNTLIHNNKKEKDNNLNITQKYIIIYGIAAGMSYLHSNNVIHRDLKPGNIFLDDSLRPKISGFNISKQIEKIEPNKTIKGTPAYIAPEVYLHKGYCKASDVYSFALVMYELLTETKPFPELTNPKEIMTEVVQKNHRPTLTNSITIKFKELIEKCWSPSPSLRPTFDEIVNELKTNEEFLTDEIQKYIDFIDKSKISFKTSNRINQIDEYINFRAPLCKCIETKINRRNIWETETNDVSFDSDFININTFEKKKLIQKQLSFKYHEVYDTKTDTTYISKQKNDKSSTCNNSLFSEIEIVSQIHHPSLLNFIGYSPVDFKKRSYPVIISENASNGTLEKIFQYNNIEEENSILDDTKKLIILYGIAAGMSYLQLNNIVHGKLFPSNVYLNDFLFPKISGFEDSKKFSGSPQSEIDPNSLKVKLLSFTKVNNYYKSPEADATQTNHPVYDTYSYAMIAYRLITGKNPFEDDNLRAGAFKKICFEGLRPKIPESTPNCYTKLIEKCWSKNLDERPTFEEIIYHLKTNPEFITQKVNKEEFNSFVQFIEKSSNEKEQIDDFIQTQNQLFRKVKIDFIKLRNWEKLHFQVNVGTLNIHNFEKQQKVGSGGFGSVYKCIEKKIEKIYAAKISIYEVDQCPEDIILNLSREIDIISSLNHPSIFKYIGYSPNNFKNKPKPVIITEYAPNGSLDVILEKERNGFAHHDWDDTKKLINIYGIASGMRYLHYKDILHRDLKPANILLDEFLHPKIADFGLSKKLTNNLDNKSDKTNLVPSGFKGTYAYCAPEIILNQEYTKKGDVFSFGVIVFEMISGEQLYAGYNQYQLLRNAINGCRPEISQLIPYCYRKLIEKCWNSNPEKRPSFGEIVELLETDQGFITENVNKDDYLNYIAYIKDAEPIELVSNGHWTFLANKKNFEKTQKLEIERFKVSFDIDQTQKKEKEADKNFLDLSKYERLSIINKGTMFKNCQVKDIETGQIFIAQISLMSIGTFSNKEKEDLIHEIDLIKQLKHPSLLKFIGFSPVDFKNKPKPVIVMETFENATLEDVLEIERNSQSIPEWNDTKKLINIYGIASAMSYLHSRGIVHRCLNPSNVYLNEILFPKLGDFGLSTKFFNKDSITHQSITGYKGSPIYSAPEIIQFNKYTQKSDVYAFAFVVYEMISKQKPFSEITNMNDILNEVVIDNKRPKINNEKIPFCYRRLIEQCWSQEPSERPTFDDIIFMLKNNSDFITDTIDSESYQKYIKFIEDQVVTKASLKVEEIDDDNNDSFILLHHQKEAEKGNIESIDFLAKKYSQLNDAENTFKYFNMLIQRGKCDFPLEYAIRLYENKVYEQAFKFFQLICKTNHPIARYFIGLMKYNGTGCKKDIDESYRIMKYLSENGIDRATKFLEYNFQSYK